MFKLKNKNLRLICLMLTVVMLFSITSTVWAAEEVKIDDVVIAEEVYVCEDGCTENAHIDEGFVDIQPTNIFCGNGHNWGARYAGGHHTNDWYCLIYYWYEDCKNLLCGQRRTVGTHTDSHSWVQSGNTYRCRTCPHPYPW